MLITIGRVLKPHGVKGEVRIEPLTDHPRRFGTTQRVFLVSSGGKQKECAVRSVRYLGDAPLLGLAGYETPEKAKELNGWLVQVPEEEAVPLPEGRYYWFELIGMDVEAESGEKLGRITDVFPTGSNDVYVMRSGKREIYLPATKEVIKQVDREARRMVIHVIEGLLD
jgi:16S rRNA processing protein RimM